MGILFRFLEKSTVPDDDARSFPVHVDFADEGAEDLCKYEALISDDPDSLHVYATTTNHGVATRAGGTYSEYTRLHDKTPPSGWPGLTSKAVRSIAEVDDLFSPEGDLAMGDGAEIGVQFEVIDESYVTAARTGDGRVVLKNLKKYHVVDSECVQDTSVTQDKTGTVDFTAWPMCN